MVGRIPEIGFKYASGLCDMLVRVSVKHMKKKTMYQISTVGSVFDVRVYVLHRQGDDCSVDYNRNSRILLYMSP